MADTDASSIEIWARIEKDEDGYPESQDWEDLWAWPLRHGLVKIHSIPFFAKDIAVGDVAATTITDDGWIMLQSILERSGHSTFRIWMHDATALNGDAIMADLRHLGAGVELTLERLVAIDAPPDHESEIRDYLEAGKDAGRWGLQVGYSPE